MKIRKMKSNLDERQELKLLKIEHNGCWIAFWGLLIVMLIQMIVGNDSIKNLAGEWVVFMSLALYLSIVLRQCWQGLYGLVFPIGITINLLVQSQPELLCLYKWKFYAY